MVNDVHWYVNLLKKGALRLHFAANLPGNIWMESDPNIEFEFSPVEREITDSEINDDEMKVEKTNLLISDMLEKCHQQEYDIISDLFAYKKIIIIHLKRAKFSQAQTILLAKEIEDYELNGFIVLRR